MSIVPARGSRVNTAAAERTYNVRQAIAESAAGALRALLGRTITGAVQDAAGGYPGRRALRDADLVAHFTGEQTVAINVIRNTNGKKTGRFFALDVDERFPQRLPLLAAAIERRGLAAAAICTSGSDEGRGKIIVFFARNRTQNGLFHVARGIIAEASQSASWGITRAGSVTPFPLLDEGGLLRIGGRNRSPKRAAADVDVFFGLDGEAKSLADVVPATRLEYGLREIEKADVGAWVARYVANPWTYEQSSREVFRRVQRLAHEAARVYGFNPKGRDELRRWTDAIWTISPAMRGPSPSGDERADRTWQRRVENAWKHAGKRIADHAAEIAVGTLSHPGATEGLRPSRQCSTFQPKARHEKALGVLRTYADAKGMTEDCFAISYREIVAYGGFPSTSAAWRAVRDLERAGLVVIHDRGTRGEHGLPTILGIVPAGMTADEVREIAAKRRNLIDRRTIVANYNARKAAQQADEIAPLQRDDVADSDTAQRAGVISLASRRRRKPQSDFPPSPIAGDPQDHEHRPKESDDALRLANVGQRAPQRAKTHTEIDSA